MTCRYCGREMTETCKICLDELQGLPLRQAAMQGLADALRDCTKWIEGPRKECVAATQMDLLDQARAALAAVKGDTWNLQAPQES